MLSCKGERPDPDGEIAQVPPTGPGATKNLPGHKTDVQESQWLMKLHRYGLLRNSFRPPQEIRTLRTYWRQRNDRSEAGWDMSRWKDESHFVSWLRLCPDNRISGTRSLGKAACRRTTGPVSPCGWRLAPCGEVTRIWAQFRRLKTKLGAPIATKAMAAKLARLVYRMLGYSMKYLDREAALYEA